MALKTFAYKLIKYLLWGFCKTCWPVVNETLKDRIARKAKNLANIFPFNSMILLWVQQSYTLKTNQKINCLAGCQTEPEPDP